MDVQLVMSVLNDALENTRIQRSLTPIKVASTPVRCILKKSRSLALLYQWMVGAEPQIISALSASGEAPKLRESI